MATIVAAAGGGNWSVGTTWVGGVAPTAADSAQVTATAGNITIDAGSVCRGADFTGYLGTLTHTAGVTFTIGDATSALSNIGLKFVSTMTYTKGDVATSAISFVDTSGTAQTIDSGGKTLGNVTFTGNASSSYQLVATMATDATASVNHLFGTLDTNGQTCSWGAYTTSGSGNARTLTLGASTVTLTKVTGTVWSVANTPFTLNAGTSTVTNSGQTGAFIFSGGSFTYNNVSFSSTQSVTLANNHTFNNFTFNFGASTGAEPNILLSADQTIIGTLTITGTPGGLNSGRVTIAPSVFNGSGAALARTVTAAVVSLTNVNFHYINAQGASIPWTGSSMADGRGNSNITFDAARTLYWIGTTGGWESNANWSFTSGGPRASTWPIAQDTVIFDANSIKKANQVVGLSRRFLCSNMDASAVTNTPVFALGTFNPGLCGSVNWGVASVTGTGATLTYIGTGNHTITHNGTTYGTGMNVTLGCGVGTYTLQDDLNMPSNMAFTFSMGTLDLNGSNFNGGSFNGSNSNVRTLKLGSGTMTLGSVANAFTVQTTAGLTVVPGTSTIVISEVDGAGKILGFGGLTFYNLTIVGGGLGDVTFQGTTVTGTFNNITIQNPKTIKFPAGTITTVNSFNANGLPGNLVTLRSTINGYQWKLNVKNSYSVSYVDVQDSNAI